MAKLAEQLDRIEKLLDNHELIIKEHDLSIHGNPKNIQQLGLIEGTAKIKETVEGLVEIKKKALWILIGAGATSGAAFTTIAHYLIKLLEK